MDPSSSSSNCENIGEVSRDGWAEGELLGMDKELLEKDFSSSAATAALDCEDSRDGGDAQELLLNNEDFKISGLLFNASSDCEKVRDNGDAAEEELGINLIKAAMKGNAQIFDEPNLSLEHFSRKSVEKNNILHIALRYNQIEFVEKLLSKEKYMAINVKLLSERNSHGNTPFHVAAQVCSEYIVKPMYRLMYDDEKPWRAQNSQGNTALHVALLSRNYYVADFLVKRDGGLARMVNNSLEAPLHLAITHLDDLDDRMLMTDVLLKTARCVATWRDAKGLTPLLRVASLSHPCVTCEVTKQIIDVCPESTLMCDPFGKSFLHLFIHNNKIFRHLHPNNLDEQFYFDDEDIEGIEYIEELICLNEVSFLKDHQDQDGNTPLHIALICGNIHMARSLVSKCSADPDITNKDGISARFMIDQLPSRHQIRESRAMKKEESSSASKGDINFLLEKQRNIGPKFCGSQDDDGTNFLHLLMSKTTEHHYLSSSDDFRKFFRFIESALYFFPTLVCQTDQKGNTPLHILAQNKDFGKTLADQTLDSSRLLSKLLSVYAEAINIIKLRRTTTNESDNHDQLPWVMQNADGNTPLHEGIIANNKVLVLELLRYSKESATIVNNHKETPLHLLAATSIDGNTPLHEGITAHDILLVLELLRHGKKSTVVNNHKETLLYLLAANSVGTEEFTIKEMMMIVNANIEALGLPDKDGLIPISRAVKAENLQMVVTLLRDVEKFSDIDGQKFWHLILTHPSKNFINGLLQNEAFKYMLQQKDKNGNTPLHLAIKEKSFEFVQNMLETWEGEGESSERNQLASNQWLMDLLNILDNDGLTPIIGALKADNLNLATRLCHVNPEAAKIGDCDGKTIWHLLPKHQSYNSEKLRELLNSEALRETLKQKDRGGNTSLHLAIKGNCFDFVQHLLETSRREHESSNSNQWLIDLLRIPNNVGQTPEDLLADLPTLSRQLEERLLTDRRTKGIRSSWKIPRTQLQNYMNSMNVIAALQTTITFTAAFTVPGGLIQDTGTPILIRSIAFQVFMISDVIAMCLSMMVLICLLWMVATNKRKSVMIQDFAITLLLASFFATLLTFMTGVYATVSHVKPWIAIVTLVLCSLLMLFIHRFMVTELLLPLKNAISNFVHMLLDPAAKAIKKLRSDESEQTCLDNSNASPFERNIVITE